MIDDTARQPRGDRRLRVFAQCVAVVIAIAAAVVMAGSAPTPRAGAWAGIAGVLGIAVGVRLHTTVPLLAGLLALTVQYAIGMVGRDGLDTSAPVVGALLAATIEGAHWAVEGEEAGDERLLLVAGYRLGRVLSVAGVGWLVGSVVLVGSAGVVDPVVARAVAVALLVSVWMIIISALRRRLDGR